MCGGLSPLAQGTRPVDSLAGFSRRFIPAGAGNTFFCTLITPSTTVYPRWRREHHLSDVAENTIAGLSPLAQGTLFFVHSSHHQRRFIPAGAGNTAPTNALHHGVSVYPRWRREHSYCSHTESAAAGLSPLAQGTPEEVPRLTSVDRFIPAGAGNTRVGKSRGNRTPVYPRWRREHPFSMATASLPGGLSPLAQGTLYVYFCVRCASRFIPAGAGNTSPSTPVSKLISVYPRWRREHAELEPALPLLPGLSPLAQGTRRFCRGRCHVHRFIPAGAGNTARQYEMPLWSPVYPRWRREHTKHTYLFLNNFIPQQQSTN